MNSWFRFLMSRTGYNFVNNLVDRYIWKGLAMFLRCKYKCAVYQQGLWAVNSSSREAWKIVWILNWCLSHMEIHVYCLVCISKCRRIPLKPVGSLKLKTNQKMRPKLPKLNFQPITGQTWCGLIYNCPFHWLKDGKIVSVDATWWQL